MTIKHSRYHDDAVQSLRFDFAKDGASVGVLQPGTYLFPLKAAETMTVVAGEMFVTIDDAAEFKAPAGTVFEAPANSNLQMRCTADVAYFCQFHS
ncbi:MAG TPA: pyrimidine/purine nucleoside phosphorylase [Halothiobacillus sp.]|nr:pyrimidine/purine nucleoside phosphorylase [Halothiobacillus sp.]